MYTSPERHVPVLLAEVLEVLRPQAGEVLLDGTLGMAGHARAVLERVGPTGRLIGLDADERNLALARENLAPCAGQVTLHHANARDMEQYAAPESVDMVLLDLGLSSLHLDEAERGFSYVAEGPLDMRMDRRLPESAADIVRTWREEDLANVLWQYGELRSSRRVAAAMVAARQAAPIVTTTQLAAVLLTELPRGRLAQCFQALRIAVNDELWALTAALPAALRVLRVGGRLAVISFHSLEDGQVKHWLREQSRGDSPTLKLLTKKPRNPSAEECAMNPRARSAHLRAACKL